MTAFNRVQLVLSVDNMNTSVSGRESLNGAAEPGRDLLEIDVFDGTKSARAKNRCNAGRHRQWPAVGLPYDIVDLLVKVIHPDHWEAVCAQGMVVVVDRDFSRTLLMGSMSFSCSRL